MSQCTIVAIYGCVISWRIRQTMFTYFALTKSALVLLWLWWQRLPQISRLCRGRRWCCWFLWGDGCVVVIQLISIHKCGSWQREMRVNMNTGGHSVACLRCSIWLLYWDWLQSIWIIIRCLLLLMQLILFVFLRLWIGPLRKSCWQLWNNIGCSWKHIGCYWLSNCPVLVACLGELTYLNLCRILLERTGRERIVGRWVFRCCIFMRALKFPIIDMSRYHFLWFQRGVMPQQRPPTQLVTILYCLFNIYII